MKRIISAVLVAATLATTAVATTGGAEARDRAGAAIAGGVVGLATGLIIGGAMSQRSQPVDEYYDEPVYVAPRRVYVQPEYQPAPVYRRAAPNCVSSTRYDVDGKPFEWQDCN